ncbi:MAG: hypothetical protein A2X58_09205 [Nitrospirae bacterium GWC2_56_14]|nr:MAG: hypothetical protein A2X58_09205 [Nitrospirae bacterium GWC2_56_14]
MPDIPIGKSASEDSDDCIAISLQPAASHLRASDGREVPFTRAVLSIHHACASELIELSPHVTLGQEGGTVQDVTRVLSGLSEPFTPGKSMSWDVYDLLLPAHPGTASKLHMFGYRAALNWRFELAVWVEYRRFADSPVVRTSVARWVLRWSVPDSATGAVVLTIEEGKD